MFVVLHLAKPKRNGYPEQAYFGPSVQKNRHTSLQPILQVETLQKKTHPLNKTKKRTSHRNIRLKNKKSEPQNGRPFLNPDPPTGKTSFTGGANEHQCRTAALNPTRSPPALSPFLGFRASRSRWSLPPRYRSLHPKKRPFCESDMRLPLSWGWVLSFLKLGGFAFLGWAVLYRKLGGTQIFLEGSPILRQTQVGWKEVRTKTNRVWGLPI